jgi:hypothetical protein
MKKVIERLVADGEVPSMAVAVARDGEIIWEEGFGLADRERNLPATGACWLVGRACPHLRGRGCTCSGDRGIRQHLCHIG